MVKIEPKTEEDSPPPNRLRVDDSMVKIEPKTEEDSPPPPPWTHQNQQRGAGFDQSGAAASSSFVAGDNSDRFTTQFRRSENPAQTLKSSLTAAGLQSNHGGDTKFGSFCYHRSTNAANSMCVRANPEGRIQSDDHVDNSPTTISTRSEGPSRQQIYGPSLTLGSGGNAASGHLGGNPEGGFRSGDHVGNSLMATLTRSKGPNRQQIDGPYLTLGSGGNAASGHLGGNRDGRLQFDDHVAMDLGSQRDTDSGSLNSNLDGGSPSDRPDTHRSFSIPLGNREGTNIPSMNQTPVREDSDPYIYFLIKETGVRNRDPNSPPFGRILRRAVNRDTRFSNRYSGSGSSDHYSAASNSSSSFQAASANNQQGRRAVFDPRALNPSQLQQGYLHKPLQNPWANYQQAGQFGAPTASRTLHPLPGDPDFLNSFLDPVDNPLGTQISNPCNTLVGSPYHTTHPGKSSNPQNAVSVHPFYNASPRERGLSFSHMGNRPHPYLTTSHGEGGSSFSHIGNHLQPYILATAGEGGSSFRHTGNHSHPYHTANPGEGGLSFSLTGNHPHSYHTASHGEGSISSFSHRANRPRPCHTASPGQEESSSFSHMGNRPHPYHSASHREGGLSFSHMGNRPRLNHIARPESGGLSFSHIGNRLQPYDTTSTEWGGLSFSQMTNHPQPYRTATTRRGMVTPVALTTAEMTNQIHIGAPSSPPDTCDERCELCHIKVSYWPMGCTPFQDGGPPPVAILPCQHVFHEHCLDSITPPEMATDPPCLACGTEK